MKYIIHACPERMWYVERYLVRSMLDQGIENIDVICDENHIGNLESTMSSFSDMVGQGGSWHLSDDVIICRDFADRTAQESMGVICGYVWDRDVNQRFEGHTIPKNMWWSFPCIYIPNTIARECAEWYYADAKDPHSKYTWWRNQGKFDDFFFKEFLMLRYPDFDVYHMKPNLVDHVDYLIGGSLCNSDRKFKIVRAAFFEDVDLVDQLEEEINKSNKN